MMLDRDKREKTRISGVAPETTNPLVEARTSAGFAPNAERFMHTQEVAKKLTESEQHAKQHRMAQIDSRRKKVEEREHDRWAKLEAEDAKAKQDAKLLAGTGMRNKGSVGYNLVNGSWGSSEDAAKAKFHDDCVEFAAKQRSAKLDHRGNSGSFNVITGEERVQVKVPPVPRLHAPEGSN